MLPTFGGPGIMYYLELDEVEGFRYWGFRIYRVDDCRVRVVRF